MLFGFVHTYADILKNKKIVSLRLAPCPLKHLRTGKIRAEALDNFLQMRRYIIKGDWNKEECLFDRLIANIAEKAILKVP